MSRLTNKKARSTAHFILGILLCCLALAVPDPALPSGPEDASPAQPGGTISDAVAGRTYSAETEDLPAPEHLVIALEDTEKQGGDGQEGEPGPQGAGGEGSAEKKESDVGEMLYDPFAEKEAAEELADEVPPVADPLYPLNLAMFHVNDKLYFWLFKPAAQVYSYFIPEFMRIGISNFFYNLAMPIRLVNNLLQGKFKYAGNELVRFVVNTTAGVAGFADFAKNRLDLPPHDEDLGQTFGTYGMGHGIYLIWPILGPSSVRDTIGWVGDRFLSPTWYITPFKDSMAVNAVDTVNKTSLRIGDYETIKDAAVDPYVSIRDAYIQNRKKVVAE